MPNPKKVMAKTMPADRVTTTKAMPKKASSAPMEKNASSDQVRLVNGSLTIVRAMAADLILAGSRHRGQDLPEPARVPAPHRLPSRPPSCVTVSDHQTSGDQGDGAVEDHPQEAGRRRELAGLVDDGGHRVGQDQLGSESAGVPLPARGWRRTGSRKVIPTKAARAPAVFRMINPSPRPNSPNRAR